MRGADEHMLRTETSGSQTMAYVMGLQQGWPTQDLKFQGKEVYNFVTDSWATGFNFSQ